MKTVYKVLLVLFGVILPAAAFVTELSTGMCSEIGVDPMPTWMHGALVASVPLANLLLFLAVKDEKGRDSTWLRALAGFTIVVSVMYAILFAPLSFFGIVLACLFFWYFGAGLIGLLPCAPFFAFLTALILRQRLAKGPGFWRGAFAALAVFAVLFADSGLMAYGVRLARSSDPATAARGIRLCRISTQKDVLKELCRGYYRGPFQMSLTKMIAGRESLSHEEGSSIYYRVTGEDPSVALAGWWSRGRRGISWDMITGGEKVGGELEGLSMKGSAWETTLDKTAGIGYGEWTMTFGNTWHSDREARMRIALPHGAVVSRVTLWINGEECEAAFGKKGDVRRAYESVVRRNRDPLLVNVCGPDMVQVQCFPVPRDGGEMKIRVGVTIPMDVAADGKSARLPVPAILERNFAVAKDLPGLPEAEQVAFEGALPQNCYYAEDGFAALEGSAILQTVAYGKGWEPKRIAVVMDTSASMEDAMPAVFAELGNLPQGVAHECWIVDDEAPTEPVAGFDGRITCVGGRSNLRTLLNAVTSLGARGESAALVWVHGPQPVADETGDALAAALNKAENVRLFNLQVAEGPCPIFEALAQSERVVSLTSEALAARRDGTFGKTAIVASALRGEGWRATREKVAKDEVPQDAPLASKHLGRLWAAEETALLYKPGHPMTLKATQELALPWHIVTPVTGAVVLESRQQYEDNGLEQVNAESVPTVPEPSSVLCLAIAFCVLLGVMALRRRAARRA